jgi:hypothetical protein
LGLLTVFCNRENVSPEEEDTWDMLGRFFSYMIKVDAFSFSAFNHMLLMLKSDPCRTPSPVDGWFPTTSLRTPSVYFVPRGNIDFGRRFHTFRNLSIDLFKEVSNDGNYSQQRIVNSRRECLLLLAHAVWSVPPECDGNDEQFWRQYHMVASMVKDEIDSCTHEEDGPMLNIFNDQKVLACWAIAALFKALFIDRCGSTIVGANVDLIELRADFAVALSSIWDSFDKSNNSDFIEARVVAEKLEGEVIKQFIERVRNVEEKECSGTLLTQHVRGATIM